MYTCSCFQVCRVTIEEKDKLLEHLKTHLAKIPYTCGLCRYSTEKKEDLILHKQISHQIRMEVRIADGYPQEVTGGGYWSLGVFLL